VTYLHSYLFKILQEVTCITVILPFILILWVGPTIPNRAPPTYALAPYKFTR